MPNPSNGFSFLTAEDAPDNNNSTDASQSEEPEAENLADASLLAKLVSSGNYWQNLDI